MLAVVGTIPEKDFPLVTGEIARKGNELLLGERRIPVRRGTPALLAAAIGAGRTLGKGRIFGFLAGDIGLGDGSRRLHEYLGKHLGKADFSAIVFHYVQPDIEGHDRVMSAIDTMAGKPVLIADAGFMYAAKMSGRSSRYDLFTPDAGELAFLADETAPHPFYARGFVLHEENRVPELIARAYAHGNAARYLLVKGQTDYVASREGVLSTIREPSVEALEAIGGTGDTLTGIAAALIAAGRHVPEAATIAARVNRLAGSYADPDPGTPVRAIIPHISRALEQLLREQGAEVG
jgi:NAD(P)H-hydrate repair Nnr-like enzyme with NAD(P)H-hydrate dehydratase domain